MSAAANLYKQFVPRSTVWIETVWHSDGFTEIMFRKKLILKVISRHQKHAKLPSMQLDKQNGSGGLLLFTEERVGPVNLDQSCNCI